MNTIYERCSMREEEIVKLWKNGIDKNKLAEIYKRSYNQQNFV